VSGHGAPARVIVCDDSPDLRAVVRMVLERDGTLQVVGEAGDASGAVALAASERPDVIVLDLTMPGAEPDALVSAVRMGAPDAGLIVYSGIAPHRARDMLGDRGDVLHVPKTSPPRDLVAAVRSVTER